MRGHIPLDPVKIMLCELRTGYTLSTAEMVSQRLKTSQAFNDSLEVRSFLYSIYLIGLSTPPSFRLKSVDSGVIVPCEIKSSRTICKLHIEGQFSRRLPSSGLIT